MPCPLFSHPWCDVSLCPTDTRVLTVASMGLDMNRSQFFLISPKTFPLGDIFPMTPGPQPWDGMSSISPRTSSLEWHVP